VGLDGAQLSGIAAIIVALTGAGIFTVRGHRKQKAGVPASEAEIESNLHEDKKRLTKALDELQANLTAEQDLRRQQAEAHEQRRIREARVYNRKINELVQQRNELADNAARNRRRFIEKYGEEELRLFIAVPDFEETWTSAELRELKKIAEDAETA
jgi:hypothetical protein